MDAKVGHRRIYVVGKERRWSKDENVFTQWQRQENETRNAIQRVGKM